MMSVFLVLAFVTITQEETKQWVQQQVEYTNAVFSTGTDLRGKIRERFTSVYNYPKRSCVRQKGEHFIFSHNSGLQNQSV